MLSLAPKLNRSPRVKPKTILNTQNIFKVPPESLVRGIWWTRLYHTRSPEAYILRRPYLICIDNTAIKSICILNPPNQRIQRYRFVKSRHCDCCTYPAYDGEIINVTGQSGPWDEDLEKIYHEINAEIQQIFDNIQDHKLKTMKLEETQQENQLKLAAEIVERKLA